MDLKSCLAIRGVTAVKAAEVCHVKKDTFYHNYLNAVPKGSYRWNLVCERLRDVFKIGYNYQRGWYCMTGDEYLRVVNEECNRACHDHSIKLAYRGKDVSNVTAESKYQE